MDAPIITTHFKPAVAGGELGFGAVDPVYRNNLTKVTVDNSSALWGVHGLMFMVEGRTFNQNLVFFGESHTLLAKTLSVNGLSQGFH